MFQNEPSLTKARNVAISYAKNEIVICSDDDIIVYSNTIQCIYEIIKRKEIALIAGIDDNAKATNSKIGYFLELNLF